MTEVSLKDPVKKSDVDLFENTHFFLIQLYQNDMALFLSYGYQHIYMP